MNGPIAEVEPLPERTSDLLDLLEQMFPLRCIRPGEDPIEAHRYAAKRELIDELRMIQKMGHESSVLA